MKTNTRTRSRSRTCPGTPAPAPAPGPAPQIDTSDWPRRPYCSADVKTYGLHIRPLAQAAAHKYVQINPPAQIQYLIFDVDHAAGAWAWESDGLPPPAWTVTGSSGHGHIVYRLARSVCKSQAARQAPQRWAKALYLALRSRMRADPSYSRHVTRSPLHPGAHVWTGPDSARAGYDLGYLAEFVARELAAPAPEPEPEPEPGHGRNRTLFDTLRVWAYVAVRAYVRSSDASSAERFAEHALQHALERNSDLFATRALSYNEVKQTAKSVARWTWRHAQEAVAASDARFSAVQAARGRAGGAASGESRRAASADLRAQACGLHAAGRTQAQIALALDVQQSTVSRWLKPG